MHELQMRICHAQANVQIQIKQYDILSQNIGDYRVCNKKNDDSKRCPFKEIGYYGTNHKNDTSYNEQPNSGSVKVVIYDT